LPSQHALGLGVDAWNGEYPFAGGAQDAVLGDVGCELVVPDLQREREPVVAV